MKQVETVLMIFAAATTAFGQTFVSAATGNDTTICGRANPCKTFARAALFTPAGGQITALDPGDYGSITITQPVTIEGSNMAQNVVTSGTAIMVQTSATGVVHLRNLSIKGNGGLWGIGWLSGAQLVIENVKVSGTTSGCVSAVVSGTTSADLVIKDSSFDNCPNAIDVIGNPITVEISNTQVHYTQMALQAGNGYITVTGSNFSNPQAYGTGSGIFTEAQPSGTPPVIMIDNCQISGFKYGVLANANTTIQLSRSNISFTTYAVYAAAGASLISNGNNTFLSNTNAGSFTNTVIPN
jgi:hypothetical protein